MAVNEKVLVIEDEEAIAHVLTTILSANDYTPLLARTGQQALLMAASHQPDVILLDLGLPDMDGMEVLKKLREWCGRPVLIVSARGREKEKVEALDLGADDYITKPFGNSELMARIRAALRNSRRTGEVAEPASTSYQVGDFAIDFASHQVSVGGKNVHLTQNEYRIVELLARQPGRVLTYDRLMREVWGPYSAGTDNKILRVNMANIRRKLEVNPAEPQYIQTEMGVGYRMTGEEEL